MYDDFELEDDTPVKRYAKPTIVGMSPTRFVTVAWDAQMGYDMSLSDVRFNNSGPNGQGFPVDGDVDQPTNARANYTGGLRLNSNIPVISKSSLVWQSGINFMDVRYNIDREGTRGTQFATPPSGGNQMGDRDLVDILNEDGLRNLNWTNTFFIPVSENQYIIFQGQMDLSGNYGIGLQPLNTIRYSAAAVYGKVVHERKRWGLGVSRTYRVGNLNYVPVVAFDYTSRDRKWGTEILFPARAHVRYNFSRESLLLVGFELEGQSYRIDDFSFGDNSFEIKRGEARARVEWQRKLMTGIWSHVQVGYRYDWSFDADDLEGSRDFFRGLFGSQEFGMRNNLTNPIYFQVGVSFVSG